MKFPSFKTFCTMTEKIELSKYREIYQQIGEEYKERYEDWFDGKWRITLPLSGAVSDPVYQEINSQLSKLDYEIASWKDGLAKSKKSNRTQRIGRLLSNIGNQELLKKFNERHKGKVAYEGDEENLVVVISRHPYDIAGMSYDRSWDSCKHLETGSNKHFIPTEIDAGCLVAYATTTDDTNLQNPISRLLIIPLFNEEDETDTVLYVGDKFYGKSLSTFKQVVEEWLESKQGEVDITQYCFDTAKVYDDDYYELNKVRVGTVRALLDEHGWRDIQIDGVSCYAKNYDMTVLDDIVLGERTKTPHRVSNWFNQYSIRDMIASADPESYSYNDQLQDMLKDNIEDDVKEALFKLYVEAGGKNDIEDWDDVVEELDDYIPDTVEKISLEYEELKIKNEVKAFQQAYARAISKTGIFQVKKEEGDNERFYIVLSCDSEDYEAIVYFYESGDDIFTSKFDVEDIEEDVYGYVESVSNFEFNNALREYVL